MRELSSPKLAFFRRPRHRPASTVQKGMQLSGDCESRLWESIHREAHGLSNAKSLNRFSIQKNQAGRYQNWSNGRGSPLQRATRALASYVRYAAEVARALADPKKAGLAVVRGEPPARGAILAQVL